MKAQSRATTRELIGDFIASYCSMSRDPKEAHHMWDRDHLMLFGTDKPQETLFWAFRAEWLSEQILRTSPVYSEIVPHVHRLG